MTPDDFKRNGWILNITTMKTTKIFILFTVLSHVLIISGCSGTKESTNPGKIEGIEWKLESLNGKPVKLNSGKNLTISFDGVKSGISGKCNAPKGPHSLRIPKAPLHDQCLRESI